MDPKVIEAAIERAVADGQAQRIHGKALTPFLLSRVKELTGGSSLESNIQLLLSNAELAAQVAFELRTRPRPSF